MRNAETILNSIRERGQRGLPLEGLYRLLFQRDLYLRAYAKLYANAGAMTRGVTAETVDGMSLAKIDAIIAALRCERYRWTPVRRTHSPKKNGKLRPLGMPSWSDKLLQEVIRSLLEAYYEPQFSSRSHGLINLREGPLLGWAAVQKRVFGSVASALTLIALSPAFALVALGVLVTMGRPIFYLQERMGLDGRTFRMIKFRTMRRDAESASGPVWTVPKDPCRTRLGALLRKTNLDELPQHWNVLRGDMSLVGPRPERPVYIEQFRTKLPGYMLRHSVKAGVTGWAQVHGLRGDSSLEERLRYD